MDTHGDSWTLLNPHHNVRTIGSTSDQARERPGRSACGGSHDAGQAQRVVDGGVDVARGDRVADAEELEAALGIRGERLGAA